MVLSFFFYNFANEKEYNLQYAELKNKTIKVADAKHFIMYDQPEWFYNQIDAFFNQNYP